MSINEEKWIAHRDATQAEFDKFNEGETPENRIVVRSPFTTELPSVKFLDKKEKPYKGKAGNPDGINVFQPIKGIDSQGSEITWKAQLPTVIAPRGYCTIKHDKGELNAIPIVLSLNNPDHKLFIDEYETKVTEPAYRMVMGNPGMYATSLSSLKPIKDFSESVIISEQYKMNRMMIGMIMAQLIRKPKINKIIIEDSHLRNMFLTPLDFKDPEKPNEAPNQMRISWKHSPGVPAVPIGLVQLYDLCDGKKIDENGKVLSQKRLGFQCSPELTISKFNIGIKLNPKSLCTALTIFIFFESKFTDSQAGKHSYVDEYLTLDEMSNTMNPYVLEMLAGLSTAEATVVSSNIPTGNTFNPSGVETGSNSSINDIGDKSFLKSIATEGNQSTSPSSPPSIPIATPIGDSSHNETHANVFNNSTSVTPMNQQSTGMIPPAFNGGSSQFGVMPPPVFNPNTISSSNGMPPPFGAPSMTGDRLGSFNPGMINVQQSGTI